jgi:hypothetical protein
MSSITTNSQYYKRTISENLLILSLENHGFF